MSRPSSSARRRFFAALVLSLFWAAVAVPVLTSASRQGIWDWDHQFALAAVEREALLDGTLPLWDPYLGGGMVVLQHPLSSFLVPDRVLVLIFGVPWGFKLLIAVRLAVGLIGAYVLGRALGMEEHGAALTALVAFGSLSWVAHVAFGHPGWTLLGYLPWVLLAFHRALERGGSRIAVRAAAGVALFILCGGAVYLLVALGFLLGAVAAVRALGRRSPRPLLVAGGVLALAGLLAGIRLVPVLELFSAHPREFPAMRLLRHAEPNAGWRELPLGFAEVFLERPFREEVEPALLTHTRSVRVGLTLPQRAVRDRLVEEINYAAYVGIAPLFLALAGIWGRHAARRHAEWWAALAVLLVLILSEAFERAWGFSPWGALQHLPVLSNLRTSGRFLSVAVTALAVLAGHGLSRFARRFDRGRLALLWPVLLAAVALDLTAAQWRLWAGAFPYPPAETGRRQAFVTETWSRGDRDYQTVLDGVGALEAHANYRLPSGVVAREDPRYRGEVFLEHGRGSAHLVDIRPNEVRVRLEAAADDLLVINQTWLDGWRRVDRDAEVRSLSGRIATPVAPGDGEVRLVYRPKSLIWGFLATLAGLGVAAAVWRFSPADRDDP